MDRIKEAGGTATRTGPGKVMLTLITPGKGSSGTYGAKMLEQAATDKVFPKGTHSMINHNSRTEDLDRPEGDLRNLAGVLLEDARWDGEKLVAEARIGRDWAGFVEDFHEHIGVSISASAEISESGEVTRLLPDPFNRADLVTVAGRGGEISEVLEAARAIEARVKETTNGDKNSWLASAVRSTHGSRGRYVWFEDFDEEYVYFSTEDTARDAYPTYRQDYTLTGSEVTLDGEPVEVHRRTEYDVVTPSNSPANPAGATESGNVKENNTMPKIEIEEAELNQLRESAGRATELAEENTTLKENAKASALKGRKDAALAAVAEAFGKDASEFYTNAAESAAVAEDFDLEAFATMVNEAAAAKESEAGAGDPSGVGETGKSSVTESKTTVSDEDTINALEGR